MKMFFGATVLAAFCGVKAFSEPVLHLQHADGRVGIWALDGLRFQTSVLYEPPHPPEGATLVGSGDLDGDLESDLIFDRGDAGVLVWYLSQTERIGQASGSALAEGETVALVDDWDRDGDADLLLRAASGELSWRGVFEDEGSPAFDFRIVVSADQRVIGAGDGDDDGDRDLFIATATGVVELWFLNERGLQDRVIWIEEGQISSEWKAIGVADFDGGGSLDVAWQNEDGALAVSLNGDPNLTVLDQAPAEDGWRVVALGSRSVQPNDTPDLSAEPSPPHQTKPYVGRSREPKALRGYSRGTRSVVVPPMMEQHWQRNRKPYLELWRRH